MAQHDYIIANGTGAAVRSDLNGSLAAIVSNNSGATEPGTMYAYQWWADTTTGLLKIRNAANNAWITIGTLASANLGLLPVAGGTMTGVLAVTAGTAALPGIAVSGDLNTGIFSPGADQVGIATGGTVKATIDSSGRLLVGTTSATASEKFGVVQSGNGSAGLFSCTDASLTQTVLPLYATRNTTNNTFYFMQCYNTTATANRLLIADSGNVTNANNSYTGISDIKLKENIADANSQWSDIKLLQVRNYNFKKETGQATHRQIGLIAQEVEQICPNLVDESPDRDAKGNDLGTVTKSVNYSVLYMKAVKALQEAMERIETLESSNADLLARVTALEAA